MIFLIDTHLLLWGLGEPERLPSAARNLFDDADHEFWFSAASIWEIAIKRARGRPDFEADPRRARNALLANGCIELVISSEHAAAISDLPPIHKDPFDRLLIAQARCEGVALATSDEVVARYPGNIRLFR